MLKRQYQDALCSVILAIIERYGLTWREAAEVFGLPKSTLHDLCNGIPTSKKNLSILAQCPQLPVHCREYADLLATWPAYLVGGRKLPPIEGSGQAG